MPDRFPGYDVLAKRHTPSWNTKTRDVIAKRLATPREPRFFTADEFATVEAIAGRLVPQPSPAVVPVAALVDTKLHDDKADGYRHEGMPRQRDAWRQGLEALDAEARDAHGAAFRDLDAGQQDEMLKRVEKGELKGEAWGSMKPKTFFKQRMAHDIVHAFYSHPAAWNRVGWGGPASPRGYVRTGYDERDPWEAAEVKHGDVDAARRKNARVG